MNTLLKTLETISALEAKHPDTHPEANIPSPPLPQDFLPLERDEVISAIHSFFCGSAAGPDSIRPQHLVDLTCASAEHAWWERCSACTYQSCHQGRHTSICEIYLFGGQSYLTLEEGQRNSSSQSLRHLMAKCVSSRVSKFLGAELSPQKMGCGIPFGCEAAAHAAQLYLHGMPSNHLLLELDFKNACLCWIYSKFHLYKRGGCFCHMYLLFHSKIILSLFYIIACIFLVVNCH